ncbi:Flp pilus assembly protein CpaB [Rhodoplanes sp. TEM]|uniref:Flp pilus assembly protein CpaB n=1 Tax=Rhodoplanes tepidamans TaxID=200616 RepID=A0ABT5J825_RHOTP|nr:MULTISPECIES: Flp pilus assembly protein CpaB [Rhodoplanes]MDC7785807.1 Flp pilus assembly protein CpaB [Rhodoplanes tepidamans]MDC7984074.1 Flp pilus assembly protein CpaB [Rhodoplanes sp. TEM]MDQ0354630.1 pilus assembly protein CpaB [Rhodoplanes tepidamans]
MRSSTVIMIAVAAVFGLLAVFATRSWLNSQAEARLRSLEANRGTPVAARTVVVAARPLRYGHELSPQVLREQPWHAETLPSGAFARISDVLGEGKRVVLTPIEPNEPVLALKITGPGQRATLSALVGPGMKAVTIRVNDVDGVGGFVLPGDRVDVVLTRQTDKEQASTQVLLQDVRVLAVDQVADERAANPMIPKAVTLEVDTASGQKLSLAASVGSLSLLLRKAGETTESKTARVTIKDLLNELVGEKPKSDVTTVVVTRAGQRQDYRVPHEGGSGAWAAAE